MKVLIVDPSKTIRMHIRNELKSFGFIFLEAESGKQCIELCGKFSPDIITMSIYLSDEIGFDICRQIRNSSENDPSYYSRNAIIIFITSNDTLEDRLKGFAAGATEFISKPFKSGELSSIIDNIVNPPIEFNNPKVLITDDSEMNRLLIKQILHKIGAQTIEAKDGKEALKIIFNNENDIDLLITDFHMPNMNGLELCRKIRLIPSLNNFPIIFLTGVDNKTEIINIFKSGATDYIIKPFIHEELIARIQGHLKIWYWQKNSK